MANKIESLGGEFAGGWFWVGAGVVLATAVTIAIVSDSGKERRFCENRLRDLDGGSC